MEPNGIPKKMIIKLDANKEEYKAQDVKAAKRKVSSGSESGVSLPSSKKVYIVNGYVFNHKYRMSLKL